MKKLFYLLLLTSSTAFAQPTITQDLQIKKTLDFKGVKITEIQKDTALLDSFKIPTSKAVGDLIKSQNLKTVTKAGNRTDANILVKSAYTNKLFSDTTHDPDYEIVVWPDIQGMTDAFPDDIRGMGQWMADSAVHYNVQALLQLGDISDNGTEIEYQRADTAFRRIDTLGVPYLAAIGNHDYGLPRADKVSTHFTTYFGPSRYASKSWNGGSGVFPGDHYIKFEIGSTKYLVVSVEWIPRDSSLSWASRVVDSFPDRKVIVITHAYLTTYGEYSTDTTLLGSNTWTPNIPGNNGDSMWHKFIRNHENIFMVLNGHFLPQTHAAKGYTSRKISVGVHGNIVNQLFVNYQRAEGPGWNNGGAGWFMRMRVSPENAKIYISYYTSKYGIFDPLQDSFDIPNTTVQVNSSLTVERDLLTQGNLTTNGKLYTSLPRYKVPYIGMNGQLRDTADFSLNAHILTVPGLKVKSFTTTGSIPFVGSGDNRLRVNQFLHFDSSIKSFQSNPSGIAISSAFIKYGMVSANSGTSAGVGIISANSSAATTKATLLLTRTRGTLDAITDILTGDDAGGIVAGGFSNGSQKTSAEIAFSAEGTITTALVPMNIRFITGTNGGTRNEKMRINSTGQVTIATGVGIADASAKLDIQTTTQGVLMPRMTTGEMNAIATPATGLMLRNTDAGTEYAYNGTAYKSVGTVSGSHDCGVCSPVGDLTVTITFGGTQPNTTYKVLITPSQVEMAVPFYVNNKTATTFDVTFINPAGASGEKFDWALYQ